jgi:hypothetical protein
MNLQDIALQYRQFRQRDLSAKWDAPLEQVLEVLFKDFVEKDYSCDYAGMLPKERVALYTLFDLGFMSDEQCELHVLEVDGKPVGIAHKFADRSDWNCDIIDADLFKVVAREMAIAALDHRLAAVVPGTLERLSDLRNGYIHFLDDAETMFAVRSPKWMYGFDRLPKEHRAFYVDDQGQVQAVASIGKFANDKLSHTHEPDVSDVTVVLENGADVVVDGSQLMFELLAGKGDLASALTAYAEPPVWCVGEAFEPVNKVIIYQHVQFRWTTRTLWVAFESRAEFERFIEAHHRDEPALMVPGVFDVAALGFAATVSHN